MRPLRMTWMALVAGCIENEPISAQWTEDFALTEANRHPAWFYHWRHYSYFERQVYRNPVQLAIPALGGGETPKNPISCTSTCPFPVAAKAGLASARILM